MNRNDFLRMIESSGPADRQTISEVNELIEIFPYFQSAYMLLLKGLSNTADVKFENQLRSSAMHIADREVLYYFLKKEKTEHIPSGATEFIKTDSVRPEEDSQQVVIELARNSEELINKIEKSIDKSENHEMREDDSEKYYRPVSIQTESDSTDSVAAVFIIDEESGEEEERVIYMDPGFSGPDVEKDDLLELDISQGISTSASDSEETSLLKETVDVKKLQSDLIDKFILSNPRIEPSKERIETLQVDISKPFTEERGEFLTETLARIYVTQGYYSRAIDIYERLSLKFPEKSSYFASQIEKVKELIKK